MSKRVSLFFFFLFFKLICFAQDIPVKVVPNEIFRSVKKDPNDTLSWNWKRGGIVNLNIAQGSLSNWASGGDKFSLAVTSYVNYFLLNKNSRHTWDNSLDFNFGFINTTSLGSRKNDDRFEILSKYGKRLDTSKIFISGLYDFRTQFFDGYTYNSDDSGILSSAFLSPAYVLLSAGFDYRPKDYFSLFLSPLTQRITIVTSDRISKQGYGVAPSDQALSQIGAFASINFYKSILRNVLYKGKMDLFTDYQHNPQNVDMYFTNLFNFRINRFLSATYSLDMIYDDDVKLFGKYHNRPALQVKSLIGIGFSMPLSTTITK